MRARRSRVPAQKREERRRPAGRTSGHDRRLRFARETQRAVCTCLENLALDFGTRDRRGAHDLRAVPVVGKLLRRALRELVAR